MWSGSKRFADGVLTDLYCVVLNSADLEDATDINFCHSSVW
jgi:hypothetical protein